MSNDLRPAQPGVAAPPTQAPLPVVAPAAYTQARSQLLTDLRADEGCPRWPSGDARLYPDSEGKWTIGYGWNLSDRGLPMDIVEVLFQRAVGEAERVAWSYWWFGGLSAVRQQVVINMLFNLGAPRFAGFTRMIAALESADYPRAAREMLDSKWAGQVGDRATRLARWMETGRREDLG